MKKEQSISKFLISMMLFAIILTSVSRAEALSISLHTENQGISSMSWSITGTNITIDETWGNTGIGLLEFDGLVPSTNYTVTKNITNNTGIDWNRFANELLDPLGQAEDSSDPSPLPLFVPTGFSTSNDNDGLSFAQGSGIPRTSSTFNNILVDELSDVRDFIDFFGGGIVSGAGGTEIVSFGLRVSGNIQQPFLLSQRPNASSIPGNGGSSVPEPSIMLLLGSGLIGLGFWRKRLVKN